MTSPPNVRNLHKILCRISRILSICNSRHQIRFAIAAIAAAAATSVSKIPQLHKIPVQNVKKWQKFANLPRLFLETGNS